MKAREKNLNDLPTVGARDAAALFNTHRERFLVNFRACLNQEIRTIKRANAERRYLLEDVIRSAYPDIEDHTVYMMAYDYTMRHAKDRTARAIKRSEKKARGGNADAGI